MGGYASKSTVPVTQSQNEIRKMIGELNPSQYAMIERGGNIEIMFQVNDVAYMLSPPPINLEYGSSKAKREQAERSRWRALGLLVKAKKVAILQGFTTVEREFFADTVMPGGQRLIDHHEQIVRHNYTDGPPQIGWEGSK